MWCIRIEQTMRPAFMPARRHLGIHPRSTGYRSQGYAAGYMTVRLPPTDRPATATPAETATGCKHCPRQIAASIAEYHRQRLPPLPATATGRKHPHYPDRRRPARQPTDGLQTADNCPTLLPMPLGAMLPIVRAHGVRAPGAANTAAGYKHNSAQASTTPAASIAGAEHLRA